MKTIACFGTGGGGPGEPRYDAMVEVGRLLAENGHRIVTGGYGGIGMEAPARGASESGGHATGYTYAGRPGNNFLSEMIDCGEQYMRLSQSGGSHLPLEVQYGIRWGNLLTADGFIVAPNGGPGTLVEVIGVVNHNFGMWRDRPKRLAILRPPGIPDDGWDETLWDHFQRVAVLPAHVRSLLTVVTTPHEAIEWVLCE
jgi:predicted Rossmann-fold nucleotide-binding protein